MISIAFYGYEWFIRAYSCNHIINCLKETTKSHWRCSSCNMRES